MNQVHINRLLSNLIFENIELGKKTIFRKILLSTNYLDHHYSDDEIFSERINEWVKIFCI